MRLQERNTGALEEFQSKSGERLFASDRAKRVYEIGLDRGKGSLPLPAMLLEELFPSVKRGDTDFKDFADLFHSHAVQEMLCEYPEDKEEAVLDIMKQSGLGELHQAGMSICLTDCDQEYMYRFLYDEYPEMTDQHEADVIIVDKEMLDPDAEYHWEFYYDNTTIDHNMLQNMKQLLRNTYYEIYITEEAAGQIPARQ